MNTATPDTHNSSGKSITGLTYPLDKFCRIAKRPLPAIQFVDAQDVPEPYHSLLVHKQDMTSTLGQFHGDEIGLRVLSLEIRGNAYYREVMLLTKRSQRPVEYGAIKIDISAFPSQAQAAIATAVVPLGQLLKDYKIDYKSMPSGFLSIQCDDYIGELFNYPEKPLLFGRRNTLYNINSDAKMAEIVEILPIS